MGCSSAVSLIVMHHLRTSGAGKKGKAAFVRSEEVGAAAEMRSRMLKQASKDSTDGSMGSISSDSSEKA